MTRASIIRRCLLRTGASALVLPDGLRGLNVRIE